MSIIKVTICLFVFCAAGPVMAQDQCLAVDGSLSCSSLGDYSLTSADQKCGAALPSDAICCCPPERPAVKPKYIIIAAVVAVFGGLTILSFIIKRNEEA